MSSDTVKKPLRVVLDTNILISALIYGGKPEQIYNLVLEKQIIAVTSAVLLAELSETLIKKFHFNHIRIEQLERIIKKHIRIVYPKETIGIVKDDDDNRVLEAAIESKCSYIITGDKELLDLRVYKGIKILTADQFLKTPITKMLSISLPPEYASKVIPLPFIQGASTEPKAA